MQELFDTSVLDINWNSVLVGKKPDQEEILRYSEKKSNETQLKNWYSENIKGVSSTTAKIICQRSNCVYDLTIRESFLKLIYLLLGLTILILILNSLINELTFRNFFVLRILPFLPAAVLLIQQINAHNTSREALKDMKIIAENVWDEIIKNNPTDIDVVARQLQDKIYLSRKETPLIFDWFYKIKKKQLEKEMSYSVERSVEEYNRSLLHN